MIVVKLMGNLGNQLFIYAFARSLQLKTNEKVVFDLSGLKRYYYTANLQLDKYDIPSDFSFNFDLLPICIRKKFERWTKRFQIEQKLDKVIHQSQSTSQPLVNKWSKRGCYFDFSGFCYRAYDVAHSPYTFVYGYFQSERYFDWCKTALLQDLVLKSPCNEKQLELINQIENCNSIGVSIRTKYDKRGDSFVKFEYYSRAINEMVKKIKNPRFFIFSDNIDDVRRLIRFDYPVTFVNQQDATSQLDTLSHCKHFILANSTFSWWGSYLSKNQNKLIVMPTPWFRGVNQQDIYQKGAILIPCSFER